ncbi:MAG: hypothetical protein AB7I32_00070 [Gammaproteobacteria bacterium]
MKISCARSSSLVLATSLMLAPLAQAAERHADGMHGDRASTPQSRADAVDSSPARNTGTENGDPSSLYASHSPLGPGAPAASGTPESAGTEDDGDTTR